MNSTPHRRLRSTSVRLGTVTALALSLTACDPTGDGCDSDRKRSSAAGVTVAAGSVTVLAAGSTGSTGGQTTTAALPDRGGFGTQLASCGG
ncbi:hypothetical protein [Micromonospora zhanjiangensis]|uniref:Uncharacterized protein n=1 Tax=Micromonospora zhanjiangensis TaxID=1522057 RepID=A0ABV8KEU7_9ACTN